MKGKKEKKPRFHRRWGSYWERQVDTWLAARCVWGDAAAGHRVPATLLFQEFTTWYGEGGDLGAPTIAIFGRALRARKVMAIKGRTGAILRWPIRLLTAGELDAQASRVDFSSPSASAGALATFPALPELPKTLCVADAGDVIGAAARHQAICRPFVLTKSPTQPGIIVVEARPALSPTAITPGAVRTRAMTRTPCAAAQFRTSNSVPSPTTAGPKATVVSVLGPDPHNRNRVVEALRRGRSVREVDQALCVLMPRREARRLINWAKAQLGCAELVPAS